MNIQNKVIEISKLLDDIDNFDASVPDTMAKYNNKLCDLYHYIENNTIDSKNAYRICKEFKAVLKDRREFKNNVEILHEYQKNKLKLNSGIENREFLLSQLGKRAKNLNQPYNNRIYTKEEIEEKIGG